MPPDLLRLDPEGLYCPAGDFHVDPWRPVARAVITHAHADHARPGHGAYLAQHRTVPVLRHRLGLPAARVRGVAFGETVRFGPVRVTLHPAGHLPGSAQVLVEHRGDRWVVSGDYKTAPDPLCAPFEPVPCRVFITESTFGLPVYRWPSAESVFADLHAWWADNRAAGRVSVLAGYALGKAQRLLAGLDFGQGPVFAHGAIRTTTAVLRDAGVPVRVPDAVPEGKAALRGALVLAPPAALGSDWMRRFGEHSLALASGWMAIRGPRRRRAADRGFVLSDHADWDGLGAAVAATGAERLLVTHGYREAYSRWWRERGLQAEVLDTRFEGERGEIGEGATPEPESEDA
jgi:putative mRNA 3-end processing factor